MEFLSLRIHLVQLPLLAVDLLVDGLDRARHLPLRRDALHRGMARESLESGGLGVRLGSVLRMKM